MGIGQRRKTSPILSAVAIGSVFAIAVAVNADMQALLAQQPSGSAIARSSIGSNAPGKCAALRSFAIGGGRIVSAEQVGLPFNMPGEPFAMGDAVRVPFCRVTGVLSSSPGSEINFEAWLPAQGFNGRFAGVGNGGFLGAIMYSSMARMLNRGYAVVASDRGHRGGGGDSSFASDPVKVRDFRELADHLATVAGKALVAKYYGAPPRYSYFSGCSAGGAQSYAAATRYPDDFDGILGGGPPIVSHDTYSYMASEPGDLGGGMVIHRIIAAATTMTKAKLQMVTRAALATCDAVDGVTDGFVSEPGKCGFDPGTLQCKAGQTEGCLTVGDVATIRTAYKAGYPQGSEYFWWKSDQIRTGPPYTPEVKAAWEALMDVPPPDQQFIERFAARGGKFLAYSGTHAKETPGAIRYTEEIIADRQRQGLTRDQAVERVNRYHRLFLLPGMEHCRGGPGPNTFNAPTQVEQAPGGPEADAISALEAWVEKGRAPESIVATKYNGDDPKQGVLMTRPSCAYPMTAKWSGTGEPFDARNWICIKPS